MIISLGTSYVYEHKATNIIVSNCHKIPQKEFEKKLLSPDDNFKNISEIIHIQRSLNPDTKFILTVSPVRHMKDGAHNNQLSKSSLLLAVDGIVQSFNNVYYFPSYEILIDELRDYRYYNKDLIHPSEQAVEYIWEKFSETCFSYECQKLIVDISKIIKAANHRVRNRSSRKSKDFFRKQLSKIKKLQLQNPNLDLSKELKTFSSYLEDSNE